MPDEAPVIQTIFPENILFFIIRDLQAVYKSYQFVITVFEPGIIFIAAV